MAVKINDNTITGNIYYNDVQVEKVYINNNLAWKALPENNITLKIYRRVRDGVNQFRVVLTAKYPVAENITVNVLYYLGASTGASTNATIYKNERYGYTAWREGYANRAEITSVSPQSDSTYRYTYNTYGDIEEKNIVIFNSLITVNATMTYNPPPVPVQKIFNIRVEPQYYVEDWTVSAYFDLSSTLTAQVTLRNTKSKTVSETGIEATKCEWIEITQPSPSEIGYVYLEGPITFKVIDDR